MRPHRRAMPAVVRTHKEFDMTILSRWFAPAVLAAGLGFAAMTPAPVQAQDTLTRVLVDIADVVINNGTPYYRYGNNGYNDRLIVARDRYGRPVYYRQVPYGYNANRLAYDRYGRRIYDQYGRRIDYSNRYSGYRSGPPYGNAYGYYSNGPGSRDLKCNKHGKCKAKYDDWRHDRHDNDRYWDGRRWRDRDDD
jgi:hypothetical protein